MQCPGCGAWYANSQKLCSSCGLFLSEDGEQPHLGPYRLIEKIGQGGMGIVFQAVDENLDREVAIKVLHQKMVDDAIHIERFRRETRIHSKMIHSNIVTVLDVFEEDGIMALVMELVKGCSLREYIHEKPKASLGEIIYIINSVLSGLATAHKSGIVHRDLKLSNIFLTDDGGIKIMDFGLAKPNDASDDITNDGAAIGTYYYMAPEQIVGNSVSPRSDLYSLGIILYRLCTGQLPFQSTGGAEFELMEKQIRRIPERPDELNKNIPKPMSDLVMHLLAKSPEDRPADVASVQSMLLAIGSPTKPFLEGKMFSDIHVGLPLRSASTVSPDSKKSSGGDNSTTFNFSSISEPNYGSLLWAFLASEPTSKDYIPLDLRSPPSINVQTLNQLRKTISAIPPLPEIWHEIQKIMDNPLVAPLDLANVVEQDDDLTQYLLDLSNSPAYAMTGRKKNSNIALAITQLTMDTAHEFIIRHLVPKFVNKEKDSSSINNPFSLEVKRIWFHSLAIANIARLLGDYGQVVDRQSVSMFGMLHDIGKLVILHMEPVEKLTALQNSILSGKTSLQAEWEELGYTHIDAGIMLALHWKLPRPVHRFIYFHHHPCWHTPDVWPMDTQSPIMLLHMAHIALESIVEIPNGLWSASHRSHVPGTERMLYRPLRLPANDPAVYERLLVEVDRLKSLFPELFRLQTIGNRNQAAPFQ